MRGFTKFKITNKLMNYQKIIQKPELDYKAVKYYECLAGIQQKIGIFV